MEAISGNIHVSYNPETLFGIPKMHSNIELFQGINTVDPHAEAFIRTAKLIDPTHVYAIYFLVRQLKLSQLWNKMGVIYPIVGGLSTSHSIELKNPTTGTISFNGTWVHSPTGAKPVTGTSANGLISTIVASSIATTNSSHQAYYSRTQIIEASCELGMQGFFSTQSYQMGFFFSGVGKFVESWNQTAGAGRVVNNLDRRTTGFLIGSRTSGTDLRMYHNGTQVGSTSHATPIGTVPSLSLMLNDSNSSNKSTKECAFASWGQGLTSEDSSVYYYIVQKYQSLLGRAV